MSANENEYRIARGTIKMSETIAALVPPGMTHAIRVLLRTHPRWSVEEMMREAGHTPEAIERMMEEAYTK